MRLTGLAAAFIALVLLAAGCSGDGKKDTGAQKPGSKPAEGSDSNAPK